MLRSQTVWLVPVALTLVGFGAGAASAAAQTTYPFSATYNTKINSSTVMGSDVQNLSFQGESTEASYGLTNVKGMSYGLSDPATGKFRFNTDPTTFGLQGLPFGSRVLFGSGSDKLFGTDSTTSLFDFETLTATSSGTVTLTGGEGRFTGATGTLAFSEIDKFSPDLTLLTSRASVYGSFKTVPEPNGVTTLLGMGVIGAGVLLCQRSRRFNSG